MPVYSAPAIVRCRRCRTYINPFVQFLGNGSQWVCNMCYLPNDSTFCLKLATIILPVVPAFFDFDVDTQQYIDRFLRPELTHCMVEYVAPAEYMARPPQPPVYIFVVDVSYAAVSSGMVDVFAKTLLDSLDDIPNDDGRTRVALIAVDSAIHYFQCSVEKYVFIIFSFISPRKASRIFWLLVI